jgi:signal transduction histidine kinase
MTTLTSPSRPATEPDPLEHARVLELLTAAESASRAKSSFLSTLSHELRAPLSLIVGYADLLAAGELAPERSAIALDRIRAGALHALELAEDLLDLGCIESGAREVAIAPVRVDRAVREAVDMIEPAAADRSVALAVDSSRPASALAEPRRLRQVLVNVLTNAVKYNRRGGTVGIRVVVEHGAVTVSIADQGPGIAGADRARLFAPFDRLGAEASGAPGTGLGLSVSRQLMEVMGGRIELGAGPGGGTVVTIAMPAPH